MIDAATVEEYMREANPIPAPENVDADEFTHFVALVQTRRAAAMQAPTQHRSETAMPPAAPPPRRRNVWAFAVAFVLILIVVGGAALFLGGDDPQVTDEPASSTTIRETPTSVVETPTTLAEAPPSTVDFNDAGSWALTRLTEPWTDSIVDVAPLPGGGFVVATTDGRVLRSPDGVEWIDADPQQQITVATAAPWEQFVDHLPAVISVVGDRVVVLDGIDPGLWVGNPQAGEWESIRLDTADLAGHVEPYAIASNDTEVLVLAEHRPGFMQEDIETVSQRAEFQSAEKGYLVWLADPRTGEAERRSLSPTWEDPIFEGSPGAVEWVNDRWVIALANTILVSGDGVTWTQVSDEDTFDTGLWVNALTAGPAGVIAITCGGWGPHDVYFSEDGLKWENTEVEGFHLEPLYSEVLGFVVLLHETGQIAVSPDGRTWHTVEVDPSWRHRAPDGDLDTLAGGFRNLAVSGHTVFVAHDSDGEEWGEGAFLLTYE